MRLSGPDHAAIIGIGLMLAGAPLGALAHEAVHGAVHEAVRAAPHRAIHAAVHAKPVARPGVVAVAAANRAPAPPPGHPHALAIPVAAQGSQPLLMTPNRPNTTAYATPAIAPGWNARWHEDSRYDWVGWRALHGDLFRPGYYVPPSGVYGYAPVAVGAVLPAALLDERYWIADPALYHLPPVGESYRWVRYYNDVLRVNIESGQVTEVIRRVFR